MTEPAHPPSRPRWRRLIVASALAAAVGTGPAEPGHADATVQAGWWMAPVAVAPDAPADGLVVQGGPEGELAYGALHVTFAPDDVAESLLLRVAPDSASTPDTSLSLCPLTEPFTPAQGGPMADAPAYDCERSLEAEPSADGTTYTFDVAALASSGALAVAILPTAATDRVVLSAPGSFSLTLAASPGPPPALEPSPPPEAPPTGALGGLPPVPVGSPPAFTPVASPTPEIAPAPTPDPAARMPLVAAPAAQDSDTASGSWLPPALFLGLAVAAMALWGAAGTSDEISVPPAAPA